MFSPQVKIKQFTSDAHDMDHGRIRETHTKKVVIIHGERSKKKKEVEQSDGSKVADRGPDGSGRKRQSTGRERQSTGRERTGAAEYRTGAADARQPVNGPTLAAIRPLSLYRSLCSVLSPTGDHSAPAGEPEERLMARLRSVEVKRHRSPAAVGRYWDKSGGSHSIHGY